MRKEFVATAYVIDIDKVLLIFHKKLNKWLPPGGHLEKDELPDDAVIREVKEETGVDIEIISNKLQDYDGVKTIHHPWIVQLEDIDEEHQHIDLVYIAKPTGNKITVNDFDARWFSLTDMEKEGVPLDVRVKARKALEH